MYLKKSSFYKHIDFIILDILCMEVSFVLAYYFRHSSLSLFNLTSYRASLIIIFIANLMSCYMFNTMKDVLKRSKQLEFYATVKQVLMTVIMLIIYLYATQTSSDISRTVIINFPIYYLISSYIIRLVYKSIIKGVIKDMPARQMVVLTTTTNASDVIDKIKTNINDINVKGIILLDSKDGENLSTYNFSGVPVVADSINAIKYLQTEFVDEVLVSSDSIDVSELISKISLMGIVIHFNLKEASVFAKANTKFSVNNIDDMILLTSSINIISPMQLFAKRLVDIAFGIVGSIFTIVLFIIIGPMIKMNSKGPIFFIQDRVGKNGKIFKMIKFRSMYLDADKDKLKLKDKNENDGDLMFKMKDDPRVIKGIGEFIRKTSLDEFPQFFNVLIGDMSVVGTRPPTLDEWEKYDLHHRARLAIKPGITGLWQVSGRSDIKSFEDVVRLDTQYIRNFSLWQDFSIIFKTIKVVFIGKGAR